MKENKKNRSKGLVIQIMREPLTHFLAVGIIAFALNSWNGEHPETQDNTQIVITEDDLLQMRVALRATELPPPDSPQFMSLIETKVREEVLYREALAMGLDRDDTIVKRRMAQKMDFLAEDLSALRQPTENELRQWLQDHPQDFTVPPRITFKHMFFSYDRRGDQAEEAAVQVLKSIHIGPQPESPGDPFMFQDHYPDRTPTQISSVFGPEFSRGVLALEPGKWLGPVSSGFGWHLVFIDTKTPSRIPEFEEISEEVKADWVTNQREEFKRTAYEAMRAKYEVVLPEPMTLTAHSE